MNCEHSSNPLFVDYSNNQLRILKQESGETYDDFPPFLEKRTIILKPVNESNDATEADTLCEPKHKLFGFPDWIQNEEIPVCHKCEADMKFMAHFQSDPEFGIQFADDGTLYAFICSKCKVIATFIQSQ